MNGYSVPPAVEESNGAGDDGTFVLVSLALVRVLRRRRPVLWAGAPA
jgi:MYXO-CTERM domain-containing protein